jgi:hypothetical protein
LPFFITSALWISYTCSTNKLHRRDQSVASGPAFRRKLNVRANQIASNAQRAMQKVAIAVDQAIVMGTPVDTGRARSNWIVSLGVPHMTQREPYAPGKRLGRGEGENAAAAMSQARTAIAAFSTEGSIFITNNVHYIGDLNRGTSPQAGPYYVQSAIFEAVAMLKQVRLLSRRNA